MTFSTGTTIWPKNSSRPSILTRRSRRRLDRLLAAALHLDDVPLLVRCRRRSVGHWRSPVGRLVGLGRCDAGSAGGGASARRPGSAGHRVVRRLINDAPLRAGELPVGDLGSWFSPSLTRPACSCSAAVGSTADVRLTQQPAPEHVHHEQEQRQQDAVRPARRSCPGPAPAADVQDTLFISASVAIRKSANVREVDRPPGEPDRGRDQTAGS